MNVTLIGMAGAGKSYMGKRLAKRLSLELIDVDRMLLEPAVGKPLQEILDEMGEEKFKRWEEQVMIEATRGKDGLLVSTPGSVVYENGAMEHFRATSSVIYLRVPFSVISERVGNRPRGIVGLGNKSLKQLYDERRPLYEKHAHFTIDTYKKHPNSVLKAIVDFLHGK